MKEYRKEKKNNKLDKLKDYQKAIIYTTIPFQMGAIIALGAWGGWELDKWLETKPVFTVILVILSVVIAIYSVLKDFFR